MKIEYTSQGPCFCCYMKQFEPIKDQKGTDFFWERKNEFYPDEAYGDFVPVCENCHIELLEYYLLNEESDIE